MEKAAQRYQNIHQAHLTRMASKRKAANKEKRVKQQKNIGTMSKALKFSIGAPLVRIREGSGASAIIHTHFLEGDRVVRESMGEIYQGNVAADRKEFLLDTFLNKFGSFVVEAAPFEVPDLSWIDLAQAIQSMPDNTPGTDGVGKRDLLVLSPSALWLLTLLL